LLSRLVVIFTNVNRNGTAVAGLLVLSRTLRTGSARGLCAGCCLPTVQEARQASLEIRMGSPPTGHRHHQQDYSGPEARRPRRPRPRSPDNVPRGSGLAGVRDSISTTCSASLDEPFQLSVNTSSPRSSCARPSRPTARPPLSAFCQPLPRAASACPPGGCEEAPLPPTSTTRPP
jgi:hypothetical protein